LTDRLDIEKLEHAGRVANVLSKIEEGKTDSEIMGELSLEAEVYYQIKNEALALEADNLRGRRTEEIYAQYVIQQAGCIRDLTEMSKKFDSKKHYTALVSAVKARSDIYDKVIKVGQDFGLIERKAERRELAVGVVVAKLGDEELRATIAHELLKLEELMQSIGDANLIDIDPGTLHRSAPLLPPGEKPRTNKAKANKVHRGRKVVKE